MGSLGHARAETKRIGVASLAHGSEKQAWLD